MKNSITVLTGFIILITGSMLSGCTPMPYQGGADYYVEIIYVPVPVPYPEPCPGPVVHEEPPAPTPRRKQPLVRPRGPASDTPRTKTPTGNRPGNKPVIVRDKGGSERPPEQVASTTPGKSPRKRR